MTKQHLRNPDNESLKQDWRQTLYLTISAKQKEISDKFQELLGNSDGNGAKVLEEKLKLASQNDSNLNIEIGYLVLGLAHLHVNEGSYVDALILLNKYSSYAVIVAGTKSTHGLLYVALLHSTILKELERQQEAGIPKNSPNGNVSEYYHYVQKCYLTPQIEKLMIGARTILTDKIY